MQVTVRYFAALREALGGHEAVQVAAGTHAGRAARPTDRQRVRATPTRCAAAVPCAARVNQALADEAVLLADGAEVAFFPPVTGG